jgi:hypothetical protein
MRFGNTGLVAALQLLISSSVDSIQAEITHAKSAWYSEQLENNNFITYKLDKEHDSDNRSLRGRASSASDDESFDSDNDVRSAIQVEFKFDPAGTSTDLQTARGPEQIGDHFPIRISSDDDASQIQPIFSRAGHGSTRAVYQICHPGASFINVHFSDLGALCCYRNC